jgi:hypothetical protein
MAAPTAWASYINSMNPSPLIMEMMRIFPDGLVITSGFYAVLTQSIPFAIFCMSMIEATALYHIIRWLSSYMNVVPVTARASGKYNAVCRTGFTDPTSPTLLSLSLFSSSLDSTDVFQHFPSSPIYMISAASAYVFSTLSAQGNDLAALGPSFSVKYYISMVFLFMIIGAFMCFRIFNNCETPLTVMLSVPIGLLVGALLVQQNLRLFNKSGINLLGIPQMSSVTANGQKIYVCPKAI